MRILVCGDRDWQDGDFIESLLLGFIPRPECVIQGEARGADTLGKIAAEKLGIQVLSFPANWNLYGKCAGLIRNQEMLDEGKPDLVLAFHKNIGVSKGTKDMITRALRAGIQVILFRGT